MNAAWTVPVISMAAGLVALFPLRGMLPKWTLPVMAFPVGWFAWGVASMLTTAMGWRWTLPGVLAGLVLFCAVAAMLASLTVRRRHVPPASHALLPAVTGLAVTAMVSLAFESLHVAVFVGDSFGHEAYAQYLIDTGMVMWRVMSDRGPMLPAIHAAERLFGAPITFVSFEVMAVSTVLLLARSIWNDLRLPARRRAALLAGVLLLLVTNSVWAWTTLYVHTHMLSAMLLLLAVSALRTATRADDHSRDAWLFVSALGAASVAVARPDGLPYMMVVVLAYLVAHFRLGWQPAQMRAFFIPLLALLWLVFGLAFAGMGVWGDSSQHGSIKPGGFQVLVLTTALTLLAAASFALASHGKAREWLGRRGYLVGGILAAEAVVIALLPFYNMRYFVETIRLTTINLLLGAGGWGIFWFVAIALLGVSATWRAGRPHPEGGSIVSFAILQFFTIAFVVHAVGHPGRLGWGDSFNRIAFHVVPLIFWHGATLAAEVMHELSAERGDVAATERRRASA